MNILQGSCSRIVIKPQWTLQFISFATVTLLLTTQVKQLYKGFRYHPLNETLNLLSWSFRHSHVTLVIQLYIEDHTHNQYDVLDSSGFQLHVRIKFWIKHWEMPFRKAAWPERSMVTTYRRQLCPQHALFVSVFWEPWFGISPPKYVEQPRSTAF